MISNFRPLLGKINDSISEYEKTQAVLKSKQLTESINRQFHGVIDLMKGHEPEIDEIVELQMAVNRWRKLKVSPETAVLKKIVDSMIS